MIDIISNILLIILIAVLWYKVGYNHGKKYGDTKE